VFLLPVGNHFWFIWDENQGINGQIWTHRIDR
jgi:hypothetical protein